MTQSCAVGAISAAGQNAPRSSDPLDEYRSETVMPSEVILKLIEAFQGNNGRRIGVRQLWKDIVGSDKAARLYPLSTIDRDRMDGSYMDDIGYLLTSGQIKWTDEDREQVEITPVGRWFAYRQKIDSRFRALQERYRAES